MKPSNGLRSLLNRFAVVVVTLKKEADPDVVYYRGYWKRKKVCLERADGIQPGRWPVLVLFTGYGVIAKDCTGKTDWAGRVTAGDEFLWEWKEVGEKRLLVFVRRVEVVSWLEKWEQEGWAMAGISLSAVAGVLDLEAWVEQTYRHWQTWKYWRKGKKEQQVIAALLLKRLKWPVLLAALVLSGIAYPLQTALRRQVLQQEEELSLWQRKIQLRRDDEERAGRMSRMLTGGGRLAPLFDRIAAAVPRGVTLVRLEANPPERRVEAGKPLVLKEGCMMVEGYTREPADVALFTEKLSGAGRSWRVTLERLDRRTEKADFTFRISIVWRADKEQGHGTE